MCEYRMESHVCICRAREREARTRGKSNDIRDKHKDIRDKHNMVKPSPRHARRRVLGSSPAVVCALTTVQCGENVCRCVCVASSTHTTAGDERSTLSTEFDCLIAIILALQLRGPIYWADYCGQRGEPGDRAAWPRGHVAESSHEGRLPNRG